MQEETNVISKTKKPISHETIYKIMLIVTIAVGAVFLLKNVIGKEMLASAVIGGCLAFFIVVMCVMKQKNVSMDIKSLVVSIGILCLIFIISLFSGASYSDDFPMFLAVIGMAGLYFEPKITKVQIGIVAVFLVVMYLVHPEKSGGLSQYILCYAITVLAAILFYLTIKRGRAFTEINDQRAREAEKLIESIRQMGINLQNDFESSSARIDNSTQNLKRGSASITQGAHEASDRCGDVHDKIYETKQQIAELNEEVKNFESVLDENKGNVDAMGNQIKVVEDVVSEANDVFGEMQQRMHEIAKIADQLSTISFNITLLSLNASIEAARGGRTGAGFEVVASEMRSLAESSDKFSDMVSEVVKTLLKQVEKISERFSDSTKALDRSEEAMAELQAGFNKLTEQFSILYNNIEKQNSSVSQVDYIFKELNDKVSEMHSYSTENENAVRAIVQAMDIYKVNISSVIEDTKKL